MAIMHRQAPHGHRVRIATDPTVLMPVAIVGATIKTPVRILMATERLASGPVPIEVARNEARLFHRRLSRTVLVRGRYRRFLCYTFFYNRGKSLFRESIAYTGCILRLS